MELIKQRIVLTGGAGFLGRRVQEQLKLAGATAEQIMVPRRRDYDLTTEAGVARMYDDMRPTLIPYS